MQMPGTSMLSRMVQYHRQQLRSGHEAGLGSIRDERVFSEIFTEAVQQFTSAHFTGTAGIYQEVHPLKKLGARIADDPPGHSR